MDNLNEENEVLYTPVEELLHCRNTDTLFNQIQLRKMEVEEKQAQGAPCLDIMEEILAIQNHTTLVLKFLSSSPLLNK